MAIQRGTFAVSWSIKSGTSVSGTGLGTNTIQSIDFAEESDEKEIKGSDGDVKAVIFSNARATCTLEIIPSAASLSAAKTANICPAIGATITIADTESEDSEIPATTWICTGSSKRRSVESECVVTLNLRKYAVDLPIISS